MKSNQSAIKSGTAAKSHPELLGHLPILSVKQDSPKSLELNWNICNNSLKSYKVQYYHILIFVNSSIQNAQEFYFYYWLNMRVGELIGIFSVASSFYGKKPQIKWEQKSVVNNKVRLIKQNHLFQQINGDIIRLLIDQISKKRGLISVSFFIPSECPIFLSKCTKTLQFNLSKLRSHNPNNNRIMFNIVSPLYRMSRLNHNLGLNMFFYDKQLSNIACQEILIYLSMIVIESLEVILQMKDKYNVFTCSNKEWAVSDSLQINRKYYALPRINFSEHIYFSLPDTKQNSQIEFSISIKYTLYNQNQIYDKKKLKVKQKSRKIIKNDPNTIYDNQDLNHYRLCQLEKGIFMYVNLLNQENFIFLNKIR